MKHFSAVLTATLAAVALVAGGATAAHADEPVVLPIQAPLDQAVYAACDPDAATVTITLPPAGLGFHWVFPTTESIDYSNNLTNGSYAETQTWALTQDWQGTRAWTDSSTQIVGGEWLAVADPGYVFPSSDPAQGGETSVSGGVWSANGYHCLPTTSSASLATSSVTTTSHAVVKFAVNANNPGATVTVSGPHTVITKWSVTSAKKSLRMPLLKAGKHKLTVTYTNAGVKTKVKTITFTVKKHHR